MGLRETKASIEEQKCVRLCFRFPGRGAEELNQQKNAAEQAWTDEYKKAERFYPAEYVIRMFKGSYPHLKLRDIGYKGQSIADIGCGDGRHCDFLKTLGFARVIGVELTEEICASNRSELGEGIEFKVGSNSQIPMSDQELDWLLSWNACYYLGEQKDFQVHVKEFARVLKPGGKFVFSIPQKSCFIYRDGKEKSPGYCEITSDPFNLRNGEILRMFSGADEIQKSFSPYFEDFTFGKVTDDCFGYNYHWHLGVATRSATS